jgi:CBS domain-containing protein
VSVPVSVVLERKGAEVITVAPDAPLGAAVESLSRHRIGALVVVGDDDTVRGVISERDVVRCLADHGPGCLADAVADHMTTDVITCGLDATADDLMQVMTDRRVRHIPILDGGTLAGIVSIGDVVKSRLDRLEVETQTLQQYVTGSS